MGLEVNIEVWASKILLKIYSKSCLKYLSIFKTFSKVELKVKILKKIKLEAKNPFNFI